MDDIYHYIENETNDEPEFAHDAVMSRMKNPSPSRVPSKRQEGYWNSRFT